MSDNLRYWFATLVFLAIASGVILGYAALLDYMKLTSYWWTIGVLYPVITLIVFDWVSQKIGSPFLIHRFLVTTQRKLIFVSILVVALTVLGVVGMQVYVAWN